MKFEGANTQTTPVDDREGMLITAENPRLRVQGELRRRRGLARTNIAKLSGQVSLINGFGLGPGQNYVILGSSGQVDGLEDPLALWGDAQLLPVSGIWDTAGANYTFTVDREDADFMTSVLVYARAGAYPTDMILGTFVDEVDFTPSSTSELAYWTAPELGTWYFRGYPVRGGVVGPGTNFTEHTIDPAATIGGVLYAFPGPPDSSPLIFSSFPDASAYYSLTGGGTSYEFAYGQAWDDLVITTLPFTFYLYTAGGFGGGFFDYITIDSETFQLSYNRPAGILATIVINDENDYTISVTGSADHIAASLRDNFALTYLAMTTDFSLPAYVGSNPIDPNIIDIDDGHALYDAALAPPETFSFYANDTSGNDCDITVTNRLSTIGPINYPAGVNPLDLLVTVRLNVDGTLTQMYP